MNFKVQSSISRDRAASVLRLRGSGCSASRLDDVSDEEPCDEEPCDEEPWTRPPLLPEDAIDLEYWNYNGGEELVSALEYDEALGDSPVALVDARYLISLADQGRILPRRQELPATAFVSIAALKQMSSYFMAALPIVVVSHPWLEPFHPDPKGSTLRLLAKALRLMCQRCDCAVFLDFVSLHQKGAQGEERTPSEMALFSRALGSLSPWYSHPKTWVFKVTALPEGYPDGFDFPTTMTPNQADYHDRGWCFCESSMASLAKISWLVLDLSKLNGDETHFWAKTLHDSQSVLDTCKAGRAPPITPAEFSDLLQTKSFTSKKADIGVVIALYTLSFEQRLGSATMIGYHELGWTDTDLASLIKVIESGAMPKLTHLHLHGNQITAEGIRNLATAARSGALPSIQQIDVCRNPGEDLSYDGRWWERLENVADRKHRSMRSSSGWLGQALSRVTSRRLRLQPS